MSHLGRGTQHVDVEAIREHGAPARVDPVHGPGETGSDRLHAARELASVRGFHDEVGVVVLEGVVNQAKAAATLSDLAEAPLERPHEMDRAKRREAPTDS